MTIHYESTNTPIFMVYGTLKLINCVIIPSNPVDFRIHDDVFSRDSYIYSNYCGRYYDHFKKKEKLTIR